jgi:hypothetical protein
VRNAAFALILNRFLTLPFFFSLRSMPLSGVHYITNKRRCKYAHGLGEGDSGAVEASESP